jgi:excisionase family DNA binding protein
MGIREENGHGPSGLDDRDDQLLTADQLAERLGVRRSWVYEQSRLGRIPTISLGRYRRYRWSAIVQWLAELETPAHAR